MNRAIRRLLCVDDEENILAALRRCFAEESFEIVCVSSGAAGLELLAREPMAVVLSDQRMPGMSGTEFLREVRARWPETLRIILSGFAELSVVVTAINDGEINKFIAKPWIDEALRDTIRTCFQQYELQAETRMVSEQIREQNHSLRAFNADLELRNQALEVYQELLDQIPVAILGIGTDGTIALANGHVRDLLCQSNEPPLGAHFRSVLPELLCSEVEGALGDDGVRRFRIASGESVLHGAFDAMIQPLRPSAKDRGVLVVLYPLLEEHA